ncbi:MAG: dephospho-CoA kinase [Clostridia bacterium]|nr:dephospho-CoA kinase [Clostridia bacterium]
MIIGLTGESGAGKSTVARLLEMYGFYIIDCDAISRTLDTDREYVAKIERTFGEAAVHFYGGVKRVNRKALGALVFGKCAAADAVKKLNAVSHPIIIARVHESIALAKAAGKSAVIDAPLLFEAGLDSVCDVTVGVIAPVEARIARLCARDGISADVALGRFANQKDDAFLKKHCTYIISNDKGSEELAAGVLAVTQKITKGFE